MSAVPGFLQSETEAETGDSLGAHSLAGLVCAAVKTKGGGLPGLTLCREHTCSHECMHTSTSYMHENKIIVGSGHEH